MLTLAAKADTWDALLWIGVLLIVTIGGGLVVLAVRKQQFTRGTEGGQDGAIESLRQMRDAGQITDEEYERARAKMVARVREALARERASRGEPNTPRVREAPRRPLPPSSG